MNPMWLKLIILSFVVNLSFNATVIGQKTAEEQHIEVSLRMAGHQILLNAGDSTSRVLPIVKEENFYRIQFDTEFEFVPEQLVTTINKVVKESRIAVGFIVQVLKCDTEEVVYSYEVNDLEDSNLFACSSRSLPRDCYQVLFTILDDGNRQANFPPFNPGISDETTSNAGWAKYLNVILVIGLMVGLFFLVNRRKKEEVLDPNLIKLGNYIFDKKNTELIIGEQKIVLTSKESDLLLLLYEAVNTTVEREVILNKVWGDDGDYVGRTLDVFISKLRKKLGFDMGVKIVNIRGVGYKLITNR